MIFICSYYYLLVYVATVAVVIIIVIILIVVIAILVIFFHLLYSLYILFLFLLSLALPLLLPPFRPLLPPFTPHLLPFFTSSIRLFEFASPKKNVRESPRVRSNLFLTELCIYNCYFVVCFSFFSSILFTSRTIGKLFQRRYTTT